MRPIILGYFLPKRGRNLLGILSFLCTAFFVYLLSVKRQKPDVIENPFLEGDAVLSRKDLGIDDCPVCFGFNETVCNQLLNSKVKLRTKKRHFSGVGQDLWKASAHGYWNRRKIAIKHIGNTGNFHAIDTEICSVFGKINTPCNVTEVVWQSFLNPPSLERVLKEMLTCPSKRLLSKVLETYVDKNRGPKSHHKVYFATMLNINQEPLIFQIFPAEHGWPFPKFYGSCGRAVVVEDVGLPLSLFLSYPWLKRAKLALNVLKIAKRLTVNHDRWALYLTGTTQDSFTVSPNGTVKLMDADGVIVVDMADLGLQVESKKTVDRCNKEDPHCLTFTPHDLCQGTVRDHNYYAVCRNVLADIGGRLGLLHSPPDREGFGTRLEDALSECINAQTFRRIQAVELIVGLLRDSIAQEKIEP